jgi:hypothetical protein
VITRQTRKGPGQMLRALLSQGFVKNMSWDMSCVSSSIAEMLVAPARVERAANGLGNGWLPLFIARYRY